MLRLGAETGKEDVPAVSAMGAKSATMLDEWRGWVGETELGRRRSRSRSESWGREGTEGQERRVLVLIGQREGERRRGLVEPMMRGTLV